MLPYELKILESIQETLLGLLLSLFWVIYSLFIIFLIFKFKRKEFYYGI